MSAVVQGYFIQLSGTALLLNILTILSIVFNKFWLLQGLIFISLCGGGSLCFGEQDVH